MFGPHVGRDFAPASKGYRPPIAAHIAAARGEAETAGFDVRAVQIFVAGPRTLSISLTDEEADGLRAYIERTGVSVYAHGTYQDVPWQSTRGPYLSKFIRRELALCRRAGIRGLVIHLGIPPPEIVAASLPGLFQGHPIHAPPPGKTGRGGAGERRAEASRAPAAGPAAGPAELSTLAGWLAASGGVEGLGAAIRAGAGGVVAPDEVKIYLEVPHVRPEKSLYETPEKLKALFDAIWEHFPDESGKTLVGLCIDTSHLWATGVDIASYEKAEAWLRGLEAQAGTIPPENVLIHLNDNIHPLGSGRDAHSPLFEGRIWEAYADFPRRSGVAAFVDYAIRTGAPVILERKPAAKLLDDYGYLMRVSPSLCIR